MDEKKSQFGKFLVKESTIIGNPEVFKLGWIPDHIIERKETFEFYREASIFLNYRKPNHILLKGLPGSGKTVTADFVLDELKREKPEIQTFKANCNAKSEIEIMQTLMQEFYKSSIRELEKSFVERIGVGDALVILDEVDRSSSIDNLLYFFSRPHESFPTFKGNISVILISNNLKWEDGLQVRVRSSLQLKQITFVPYTFKQIKRIVKARVSMGFLNPKAISDELIDFLAEEVEKTRRGDCRVAIETAFYAAQTAEIDNRKEILKEDIGKALKASIRASDKEKITKLRDHQLLVLYAVMLSQGKTLSAVYEHYVNELRDQNPSFKPHSRIMTFHTINCLDDFGLISKKIEILKDQKGIPHRTIRVRSLVDDDVVLDELRVRDLRLSQINAKKRENDLKS